MKIKMNNCGSRELFKEFAFATPMPQESRTDTNWPTIELGERSADIVHIALPPLLFLVY